MRWTSTSRCTTSLRGLAAAALLGAAAGAQALEVPEVRPPADPRAGARGPAAAEPAPEPPAEACYRAARAGHGDAYVCDLAVQIARDSGSAAALAAALVNRALVLAGEGRLEPALADLDAALNATPDDAAVHGNRGNLLLRMGRLEEALSAHDRAVALAAEDPVAYYNRAFSYLALGADERAEQDIATARGLLRRNRPVNLEGIPGPVARPVP